MKLLKACSLRLGFSPVVTSRGVLGLETEVALVLVIVKALLEVPWVCHGLLDGKQAVLLADIDGLSQDLVVRLVVLVCSLREQKRVMSALKIG